MSYRKLWTVKNAALQEAISATPLCDAKVLKSLFVDDLVMTYEQALLSVLSTLAPLKTITMTIHPEAKWFTDEIWNAKQIRRKAERKWRKRYLQVYCEIYLREKDKVKFLMAKAKTQYLQTLIDGGGSDSKRFFVITSFSFNGPSSTLALQTGDAQTIASALNEFFIAKIDQIHETIQDEPAATHADQVLQYQIDSPLGNFLLVNNEYLSKAIAQAKTKYCDLDPVPTQ